MHTLVLVIYIYIYIHIYIYAYIPMHTLVLVAMHTLAQTQVSKNIFCSISQFFRLNHSYTCRVSKKRLPAESSKSERVKAVFFLLLLLESSYSTVNDALFRKRSLSRGQSLTTAYESAASLQKASKARLYKTLCVACFQRMNKTE